VYALCTILHPVIPLALFMPYKLSACFYKFTKKHERHDCHQSIILMLECNSMFGFYSYIVFPAQLI
jgi:hypothetical protein